MGKSETASNSVLYEKKDLIVTITINRPEKRNALRMEEFGKLIKFIEDADFDESVHVIRINSKGEKAFSAGLDLNMVQQLADSPENVPRLLEFGYGLVKTMLRAKKPIVVQIQGPAVAWGAIICLAADFVIAGENPNSFLSLPEIDIGLFPATGALTMTLLNSGFRRSKRILMVAERLTLDDAEGLGIITRRCPLADLNEETLSYCKILAEKPQSILIPIKALINRFASKELEYYFTKETEAFNLAMAGKTKEFNDFIRNLWES
ncbi:MAG: enoyl-CoA hydratase/isomerase family protein [Candidatus Hodarchaeales archaeon]|jgi:enoyl-CoA hydratase